MGDQDAHQQVARLPSPLHHQATRRLVWDPHQPLGRLQQDQAPLPEDAGSQVVLEDQQALECPPQLRPPATPPWVEVSEPAGPVEQACPAIRPLALDLSPPLVAWA